MQHSTAEHMPNALCTLDRLDEVKEYLLRKGKLCVSCAPGLCLRQLRADII